MSDMQNFKPHHSKSEILPYSVDTDLAMATTMIVINGGETIATGPNGMNSFATLTCNAQKVRICIDQHVWEMKGFKEWCNFCSCKV